MLVTLHYLSDGVRSRICPNPKKTQKSLLLNWAPTEGADFVFTNAAGGRYGMAKHAFRKALSRAGLADLHFPGLRHMFRSQWMILGPKSIATTQWYAHLSP